MLRRTIVVALLILAVGCRSKPPAPYEGKSLAELERMLQSTDPGTQAAGAFGLSRLGPEARSAVPSLRKALGSSSDLVRQNVALALTMIGPDARDALPELTTAAGDDAWAVRRQVALALGAIGGDAAVAALEKLQQDENAQVRDAAQQALKKIRQ